MSNEGKEVNKTELIDEIAKSADISKAMRSSFLSPGFILFFNIRNNDRYSRRMSFFSSSGVRLYLGIWATASMYDEFTKFRPSPQSGGQATEALNTIKQLFQLIYGSKMAGSVLIFSTDRIEGSARVHWRPYRTDSREFCRCQSNIRSQIFSGVSRRQTTSNSDELAKTIPTRATHDAPPEIQLALPLAHWANRPPTGSE